MGWREVLVRGVAAGEVEIERERLMVRVALKWPPADRIALARELLAGTGRCVAREVGAWPVAGHKQHADGWNACRAAMMGEG